MQHKTAVNIRKWLTTRRLLNGLYAIVIIVLLVNPSAKAVLIRGLMKIGLFQPDISSGSKPVSALSDIYFEDNNGRQTSLYALRGKVVFINFWATWCPPCIAELPSINTLRHQLSANKNIVFLLVDADHNFNKSVPFMAGHQYNLPVYTATTAVPAVMLGNSIPTTVVIDRQGQMVFRQEGAADYTNLKFVAWLKGLAGEP